ncbi:MAG TPA: ComEC/Rec2 family competence protein [Stellaceae bacterium]|nr:ComEC/Rec2 family competence protein [Stellaceae bacterium]
MGRAARLLRAGAAALARCFHAERERWALWVPVFLGCGIGLYFSLTVEPPGWVGAAATLAAAFLALLLRRRPNALLLGGAASLVAAGFALAQFQTWRVAAPVLAHQLGPVAVEGRVLEIDPLPESSRIIIAPARMERLDGTRLPARIRIRLGRGGDDLLPGDWVSTRAILYPPPAPAMPGAYDFQRRAFFDRLGAVGFAVAPAVREAAPDGSGPPRWEVGIAALRSAMTARIAAALPDRSGGVAAAIITGQTHAIPEADAQAFRDAGLAHILVIAGLHMGMVAGLAFVGLRAMLALIPAVSLRYPTKKWAAAFALLVTFFYMLLSGATVSSRRSFIMTGLVLLAVLVDRLPLSARGLAYAATVILAWTPVSLTGPSFQMSFAAVGALIAFYETFRHRFSAWRRGAGPIGRAALYLLGVATTTVVCTLATTPFTIFHFNRFAVFSVAANILAVPITGFWVMPWAMIACFLMPFGLEAGPLHAMSWGIDAIIAIARGVTSWPGAVIVLPAMPLSGLLLVTAGGLWLTIWQRRWRLAGFIPIAAGLAAIAFVTPPDLLVSGDARLIAARAADGSYMLSGRPERIDVETWTRRGASGPAAPFPELGTSADGTLACDDLRCFYRAKGRSVALPRSARNLEAECRGADLVILREPSRRRCPAPTAIVDRFDLWRHGAHAIWLAPGGVAIETVEAWRGIRPWAPRPVPRRVWRAERRAATESTASLALNSAGSALPAVPAP